MLVTVPIVPVLFNVLALVIPKNETDNFLNTLSRHTVSQIPFESNQTLDPTYPPGNSADSSFSSTIQYVRGGDCGAEAHELGYNVPLAKCESV